MIFSPDQERARQRQADRDARLAQKIARAMALDPRCVAMAREVHDALIQHHYDAWIGQHANQHMVSVRGVKSDEKPKVEGIAFSAMKKADKATPLFPDCRHFASFITIEVKEGRQQYELDRTIDRFGDDGQLIVTNAAGRMSIIMSDEAVKPITTLGYDE